MFDLAIVAIRKLVDVTPSQLSRARCDYSMKAPGIPRWSAQGSWDFAT